MIYWLSYLFVEWSCFINDAAVWSFSCVDHVWTWLFARKNSRRIGIIRYSK